MTHENNDIFEATEAGAAQHSLYQAVADEPYDDPFFPEQGILPDGIPPDAREWEEVEAELPPSLVGTVSMVVDKARHCFFSVQVFSPLEAASQFRERYGDLPDKDGGRFLDERPARHLHALVHDPARGQRKLPVGSAEQVAALRELADEMPNAAHVVSYIRAAVAASQQARVPLRLDPIILLGPPGGGKTRLCRRLGEALGLPFRRISMPGATGGGTIFTGTDATWKACRPGVVTEMLMAGSTASPLIMLDEIDKAYVHPSHDNPLDPLHDLWESENAAHFRDEALGITLDASRVFWIATANETGGIRRSLLDRALVLTVAAPSRAEMDVILNGMYLELVQDWGAWFDDEELSDAVLDRLRDTHPRLARRALAAAMTIAAADQRRSVTSDDITRALGLWRPMEAQKMGFV